VLRLCGSGCHDAIPLFFVSLYLGKGCLLQCTQMTLSWLIEWFIERGGECEGEEEGSE
jgi:hypothetical protein